ncbi:MAG: thermonuclease family protein [Thermoplasmata archaeon]|nr:thermonuclease family protein [Thermoplasmata archaeon]MBE3139647.1 thermonuclease family protein [Thermoplasmata archaeon]
MTRRTKLIVIVGFPFSIVLIVSGVYFISTNQTSDRQQNEWQPEFGVNYTVNVNRVIDGDTFDVVFPSGAIERVRLLGVDVPETEANKNKENEYGDITDLECLALYGVEAQEFAQLWLAGKSVVIQFDEIAVLKEYYGRWLAYVFLPNGTDFNEVLLKRGYARVYTEGYCTREPYYVKLQNQTMDEGIGLWQCRPQDNHPPVADFTYAVDNLRVDFTDVSYDADDDMLTCLWSFGDGTTSNDENPSHTFSRSGTYIVSLTTRDGKASDTRSEQVAVVLFVGGDFSIASWNLEVFGPTKASNETLLDYYADKLDDYDLFVVQEIRDVSGTAIEALAAKLPDYQYVISERAGRTTSKEQYAVFYNNRVLLFNITDWADEKQDEFERPPFEVTFTVNSWTFTLVTIHTKPSDVPNELTNLENLVGTPTRDTIIIGDLNADGDYYNHGVISHFLDWNWVITSEMDTTVAASSNAYDRIIVNQTTENNYIWCGIMDDVDERQSDHYLVYAVFNPDVS